MGIREKLDQHQKLVTIISGAVLLVAVVMIAVQMFGAGDDPTQAQRAYFTVDDGATFFVDSAEKIAPFEHNGKTAYGAIVYRCDDGKKFVGALERYTPEAKAWLDSFYAAKPSERDYGMREVYRADKAKQVKKVGTGDTSWVSLESRAGRAITRVKCPPGQGQATIVSADE
jgi:hypothetical protein